MRVEQHLVGLLRIRPEEEGAAVAELEVTDLEVGPLARDDRKGHEDAAARGLLLSLSGILPIARESRHATVGSVVAQRRREGRRAGAPSIKALIICPDIGDLTQGRRKTSAG